MNPFPVEKLEPLPGTLGIFSDITIEVPIKPFQLSIYAGEEPEEVATTLRLDFAPLPSIDFDVLAGQTFRFPGSPAPGYIDGSIYIEHAHHPADVHCIRFGAETDCGLEVEVEMVLRFEFEGLGDFKDTPWRCVTTLRPR